MLESASLCTGSLRAVCPSIASENDPSRIAADGAAEYETTDRGMVSWLNDLHKGRNTGTVWSWFIDMFAGACMVFAITGFLIMKLHAANRPSTWPVIGLGILVPILLALLFTH